MARPSRRTRLVLLLAVALCPGIGLSGCGEAEESPSPSGSDSNSATEASGAEAEQDVTADEESDGHRNASDDSSPASNESTAGDGDGDASGAEAEAAATAGGEESHADDAALETDLAKVEALAADADFVAAYDLARRLRVKYRAHPRRAEVEAVLARMKAARAAAVEMPYIVQQLGAPDTESRSVARRKLIHRGDVAAIFLRNAVRDGAAPDATAEEREIAVQAAGLLGEMGDAKAGPLFADLLAEGVDDPVGAALVGALPGVASEPRDVVLHPLYPLVAADADHARRALAGYLIEVVTPVAGDDPEAWAERLGDASAYETIRGYVEAAQQSSKPDLTGWATHYTADLGLYEQGLKGEYFKGTEFQEPLRVALAERISFTKEGNPIPEIPLDDISARWTGKVLINRAGEYTFYASTDDGVRVWIDGELRIDSWTMRGETEDAATVTLEPGLHDLKVEWMQGSGGYACHLRWAGPGIEKQILGPEHLRVTPWPTDQAPSVSQKASVGEGLVRRLVVARPQQRWVARIPSAKAVNADASGAQIDLAARQAMASIRPGRIGASQQMNLALHVGATPVDPHAGPYRRHQPPPTTRFHRRF